MISVTGQGEVFEVGLKLQDCLLLTDIEAIGVGIFPNQLNLLDDNRKEM